MKNSSIVVSFNRQRRLIILLLIVTCQSLIAKDPPFISGEKTVYKIFYNWNFVWLSAGEVVFDIKDEGDFYHIEVTGRTYSSYEWFYKVRDKFHTYLDKKTLKPKLYIRDIQEGSYYHYEKIVFDYKSNVINSYVGKSIGDTKLTVLPMQENVYDLISTMYFLRSVNRNELIAKQNIPFKMILDNEIYNLNIKCHRQSKINVKESGTYNVLNCITDVVTGNVFRKNTSLQVNVGNDDNLIPVLIESPLSVGSVKAILKSHQNLKHPFFSKL
ncbi:MAG: DUF3108 domain-containing protein [Saprospiraceae bacterium]|nr:DUF3108 domain-containing protein [Saprospiraceae bacterium]